MDTMYNYVAGLLHEMQYGQPLNPEAVAAAKEHGLVIIMGGSDDLVVLSGTIDDEMGADTGTKILFVDGKLLQHDDRFHDQDELLEFIRELKPDVEVNEIEVTNKAGRKKVTFAYKTDLPHGKFDVLEDEDLYGVGIVISLSDMVMKKLVQEAVAEVDNVGENILSGRPGSVFVENPENTQPGDGDRAHVVYATGKEKMFLVAFGFTSDLHLAEWHPDPSAAMDFGSFTMASRATMLLNAMNMSPEPEAKIFAEPAA